MITRWSAFSKLQHALRLVLLKSAVAKVQMLVISLTFFICPLNSLFLLENIGSLA